MTTRTQRMKGTLIRLETAVGSKDKEVRKQALRIKPLLEKWVGRLGLTHWQIKFDMCTTAPRTEGDIAWQTHMETATMWPYMDSLVTVYVPIVADLCDDDLEKTFVHEMCHILVNEMCAVDHGNDDSGPREERVATQVATAILGAYSMGYEHGTESAKARKTKAK